MEESKQFVLMKWYVAAVLGQFFFFLVLQIDSKKW